MTAEAVTVGCCERQRSAVFELRSAINLVMSAAIAAWVTSRVTQTLSGEHSGFVSAFITNLTVIALIIVVGLALGIPARNHARSQQRFATSRGISALSSLAGGWASNWSDTTSVTLPRRSAYGSSDGTKMPVLQVTGEKKGSAYPDRESAAAAVCDAVTTHAPQLVES